MLIGLAPQIQLRLQLRFPYSYFMILTGISDEAGATLESQIQATLDLGWKHLEMRAVEVPGFPKGNFHDIPDKAFGLAVDQLQAAGINVHCFGSAVMNWAKK